MGVILLFPENKIVFLSYFLVKYPHDSLATERGIFSDNKCKNKWHTQRIVKNVVEYEKVLLYCPITVSAQ